MKYWTYMKGEVPGSYEPAALAALPGFTMTTLVCPGEGEIAEKNWRRAGEFDDIVRAVEAHQAMVPPAAPLGAPPTSNEVDALLDTASTRLFSHVADLMKELETRRDEKSLIVSLQRQISALKQELAAARETATMLEIRVPRIAELEEAQKKDHAALAQFQATLAAREAQLTELRVTYERMRGEHDAGKRRVQESETDLAIRNRLVDKLSHDLSEKELSLAKALGVIRRLEEDLNRLCPSPEMLKQSPAASPPAPLRADPPPPPLPSSPQLVEPIANKVLSVPEFKTPVPPPSVASFTNDDPPPPPPYLEPHAPAAEMPKAQEALMGFLRKVFPGQSH
jgi:predicted XRE-type DNA-binding protein